MKALVLAIALAVLSACAASACERVVENHSGGVIMSVAAEVAAERCKVRLRGQINSAGTLWLGARDVCLEPSVTAEFEGPRSAVFFPLSPVDFQFYSRVIAGHYNAPLARWYMATGRYGFHTIKADELIRIGYKACSDD